MYLYQILGHVVHSHAKLHFLAEPAQKSERMWTWKIEAKQEKKTKNIHYDCVVLKGKILGIETFWKRA